MCRVDVQELFHLVRGALGELKHRSSILASFVLTVGIHLSL